MRDNKGEGEGRGGFEREGELINFLPLKRWGGGLIREGVINRGFIVTLHYDNNVVLGLNMTS